jgi:hypothetical protein
MRVLVIVLALLAAAKIGTQEYLIASAKSEIIIAAYKDRALGACKEAARARRMDVPQAQDGANAIRLVIGKGSLDVALWQVDSALWQTRYKSPYLVFTLAEKPQRLYCEFDITQGSASVIRM